MPWPKLSETLPHEGRLQCQQCRGMGDLTYWIECDDRDRRQAVHVVLCQLCANKIVEKHPRLYVELTGNECMPGAMQVCDDCVFRERLSCKSPTARFNGGPGLIFNPAPSSVHFCSRKRGQSGWHFFMPDQMTQLLAGGQTCSGKTV